MRILRKTNLPIPNPLPEIPLNSEPNENKFEALNLVLSEDVISTPELVKRLKFVNPYSFNIIEASGHLPHDLLRDVIETPEEPYFIWIQDGRYWWPIYTEKKIHGSSKQKERAGHFKKNERVATLRETLFMLLYNPDLLFTLNFYDIVGTAQEIHGEQNMLSLSIVSEEWAWLTSTLRDAILGNVMTVLTDR